MKIGVLGTGSVGQTLSAKLTELGHEVMIGTRNVEDAKRRSGKDNYGNPAFGEWLKGHPHIKLDTFSNAIAFGEMIINATNGLQSLSALKSGKTSDLEGKVIVDVANPLDFSKGMPPSLSPQFSNLTSLGEEIQKTFPEAYVVKTFNTMWCGIMVDPGMIDGGNHHNFLAGNNPEAKKRVRKLLNQMGWKDGQLLDLGDISAARGTEMLLPLWLRVMGMRNNAAFNFKVAG